jgi:hypothetical protein
MFMTAKTDRLTEIEKWVDQYNSFNVRKASYVADVEWLVAEVKRLRTALADAWDELGNRPQ